MSGVKCLSRGHGDFSDYVNRHVVGVNQFIPYNRRPYMEQEAKHSYWPVLQKESKIEKTLSGKHLRHRFK